MLEIITRLFFPLQVKIIKANKYVESERGKFARYDPVLGWDGLEGAEDDFEWVDARHHVRHNKYGYRGKEYGFERTGKKRLLFLGDSYTWGFGAEVEEIFTTLIEVKTGGAVEALNMGVSGYSTDQELLLWKNKGRLWKPDHVIVMLLPIQDLIDNLKEFNYEYNKPHFQITKEGGLQLTNVPVPRRAGPWSIETEKIETEKKRNEWLYTLTKRSAFVNLLVTTAARNSSFRKYLTDRGLLTSKRFFWNTRKKERLSFQKTIDEKNAPQWMLLFKILSEFKKSVEEHNARLTVVLVPSAPQIYDNLWEASVTKQEILGDERYSRDAPNMILTQWALKNDINVIDLLPVLRKEGKKNPNLLFPFNTHWAPAGHDIVADTLLRELKLKEQK